MDDSGKFYFLGGGTAGGNAIRVRGNSLVEMSYLLGVLNSKLTTYYVSEVASKFRGGYFVFSKASLQGLPLPNADRELKEAIVSLVGRIMKKKRSSGGDTSDLEREIDDRVYKLYGLTKDEIKIVEEGR